MYSAIEQRPYGMDEDLVPLLALHLVRPVGFAGAVRRLHGKGGERFVECGGGDTLTRLVAQNLPAAVGTHTLARTAESASEDFAQTLAALRGPHHLESLPPAPEPMEFQAPPSISRAAAAASPGQEQPAERERVLAELRELYSTALGYPGEVFTEDDEFEADLGVDSIRQTELLAVVLDRFRIPTQQAGRDYPTFGDLAELVIGQGGRRD
ncbi:acyl carrier protein [Streptomyces melanogenes]|uniref:acyl carrier protein n=1 Tax=Streptomyces melanogenes TaxID=67326 RepID=UPI0019BD5F5D|nr:acyl carrier protein [Streptomyces melanogenes]GGP90763.1 hypothetical protein GCM10010278_81370 [Streptomyces melanogenes]